MLGAQEGRAFSQVYARALEKFPENLKLLMVHLYFCLPDGCRQKIHKRKRDRRFLFVQFYTVCLLYSYVFSVCTGQAD